MDAARFAELFEPLRPELTAYLTRLVARVSVAEELVQETAVRALQALDRGPAREDDLRPWLFRIASNLGIDHRRRGGPLRETLLIDARRAAEADAAFTARLSSLRGSPLAAAIAREHLTACFACTLGQLPPEQAAALLLREVYGFGNEETADVLDARFAQVKNWLQAARAAMAEKYARTCALVTKEGVCYQCVELDSHVAAGAGSPLAGTAHRVDDRLAVLRRLRADPPGTWTRMLSDLLDRVA